MARSSRSRPRSPRRDPREHGPIVNLAQSVVEQIIIEIPRLPDAPSRECIEELLEELHISLDQELRNSCGVTDLGAYLKFELDGERFYIYYNQRRLEVRQYPWAGQDVANCDAIDEAARLVLRCVPTRFHDEATIGPFCPDADHLAARIVFFRQWV